MDKDMILQEKEAEVRERCFRQICFVDISLYLLVTHLFLFNS